MAANKAAQYLNNKAKETVETIKTIIAGNPEVTFKAENFEPILTAIYAMGYTEEETDQLGVFYFHRYDIPSASVQVEFDDNADIVVSSF